MRTLQRGPNPSDLARALAELGRIIKTLHVLQYCRDPEHRRDSARAISPRHQGLAKYRIEQRSQS